MRRALNENPIVQIAVIGVLALIIGVVLITRLHGGSSPSSTAAPTPTTATGAPVASATPPATGASASTTATPPAAPTAPAGTAVPSGTAAPAAPATGVPAPAPATLTAGPGLPKHVATAYRNGETVVLLVTRHYGIDDRLLRQKVRKLRGDVALRVFTTDARDVARYARITQGVDLNRTPALVVVRPRGVGGSAGPVASVSYGFRGTASIRQAVRDAQYGGPQDVPLFPR